MNLSYLCKNIHHMAKLKFFFSIIIAIVLTGCSSPAEKINKALQEKDRSFISSDSDYKYDDSKSYFYIVEGANPLADESLRKAAFEYANAKGLARYNNDMAYSVRNTYDDNFKLAPNWYEEEKRYKQQAESYEADAQYLEQKLKDLIKSQNYTSSNGGIWVYHKLSYKEYIYNSFAGPYKKEEVFLYSDNGEQEIWSEQIQFTENQLSEILNMTGAKFTVQRSRDYEF